MPLAARHLPSMLQVGSDDEVGGGDAQCEQAARIARQLVPPLLPLRGRRRQLDLPPVPLFAACYMCACIRGIREVQVRSDGGS